MELISHFCDKTITLYEENTNFVTGKFLLFSFFSCEIKCLCDEKAFVSKKLLFGGDNLSLGGKKPLSGGEKSGLGQEKSVLGDKKQLIGREKFPFVAKTHFGGRDVTPWGQESLWGEEKLLF